VSRWNSPGFACRAIMNRILFCGLSDPIFRGFREKARTEISGKALSVHRSVSVGWKLQSMRGGYLGGGRGFFASIGHAEGNPRNDAAGIRTENRSGHRTDPYVQIPLQRLPPKRSGGWVTGWRDPPRWSHKVRDSEHRGSSIHKYMSSIYFKMSRLLDNVLNT